ncbi:hypothetical protein GLOTRDRAFT_131839 [Gloeophyllum trabeum ATCC 11539]|uniref:Uncharacterized protein n=1 Tax=Gloeophyllum trabeum (strain ATCC 11539 / FP-39264 / Madison 617) TaxID=670483 RepID=S7RJ10_GLOTA|nr:uncharacterized protein GLOTRDRAFT_131839 [Gloeophyllum trabeum ATCC 11539]EPQ52604.1 hypothetical protein GLOTRDRAFT_131839 [Gloeophyllum trabeum ATCC 11539]
MGTKATFTEQGNGPCEAAFSPKTKSQASEGSKGSPHMKPKPPFTVPVEKPKPDPDRSVVAVILPPACQAAPAPAQTPQLAQACTDNIALTLELPCRESSCYFEQDDVVYVEGMDGHMYLVPVPLSSSKAAEDYHIKGAGMPVRKGGRVVGYGDMVIRWNLICPHKTAPPKRKILRRRHT